MNIKNLNQLPRQPVREIIAIKNSRKVMKMHRMINRSSTKNMKAFDQYKHLLNKSPHELSNIELDIINNNSLLFELYRNIYSTTMKS